MQRTSSRRSRAGFSLIELVITMTIMAILVGVVSMRSGTLTNKAQASKIASTADTYKKACEMYFGDTGQSALEYTNYTGATYHRLSQNPTITGWNGPYIERPISTAENPMNTTVHLYSNIVYANGNGFDLDGDGTADVANGAAGNTLCFWGITDTLGQAVDAMIDRTPAAVGTAWQDRGRVEWQAGNLLSIMLRN